MNPVRLLLLGAPGSGKGTMTSWLHKSFPRISTLSSGDVMRSEVSRGSAVGKEVAGFLNKGQLVPDETITRVVTGELARQNWLRPSELWLLDGFPRTEAQAQILDQTLEKSNSNLTLVVELDVPHSLILRRIEARWIHRASGRVYNLDFNPPKKPFTDDVTGEKLEKREDDNVDVFRLRLATHNETVAPLREFYREKGILRTVSGESSDIIFPKLKKLVEDA